MNQVLEEQVFEDLDETDRQIYTLVTMLSTVPPNTVFPHGETDLRRQLQKILYEEREHPLIKSSFTFDRRYYQSKDIDFLMGFLGFGVLLGLENLGLFFEYRTTQKTLEIAGEAKRFLPRIEYEYFQSLGSKLSFIAKK